MTTETPHTCSFCSKSPDQVQYLIAGPGSVYICDECIDLRRKTLEDQSVVLSPNPDQNTSPLPQTTHPNATSQTPNNCSFCGKHQVQVQRLVAGPGGFFICSECIDLHRKIIEDQYAALTPNPDQNTSSLLESPNPNATSKTLYSCSFCGKHQDQVQRLIAGFGGFFICGECVDLHMEMLREEMGKGKR